MELAIVGAGIFGMAAAIELRRRNHKVTLFDQGPIPNEMASSTDVAKAIRRDGYFPEEPYIEMVERAQQRWLEWNEYSSNSVYYQVGKVVEYTASEFQPGTRDYESIMYLKNQGNQIDLLSLKQARDKFPQFAFSDNPEHQIVYDPWAGYIDSGRLLSNLKRLAVQMGVEIKENCRVLDVEENAGKVTIQTKEAQFNYDRSIIAAGPWICRLVPEFEEIVSITRQAMAFFRPLDSRSFHPSVMPVFVIYPVEKGWYGFPLLRDGTVKIAMDLVGDEVDPDIERKVPEKFIEAFKQFAADKIPLLAEGEFAGARSCLYTNTPDGRFVIDWKPGSSRILLAGGGSGHGFKFGGVIGEVIADSMEEKENTFTNYFRIGNRFMEATKRTSGRSYHDARNA